MALHPNFPVSPYETLNPAERWFPAAEELRASAYEKLLPPLVANIRNEVFEWRVGGYAGASPTSKALLNWWFETGHLAEQTDGTQSEFRYYFAQREAVESVIWLYDVRQARDKYDLLRFDASGAVSANMFDEAWPRFVVKMATGFYRNPARGLPSSSGMMAVFDAATGRPAALLLDDQEVLALVEPEQRQRICAAAPYLVELCEQMRIILANLLSAQRLSCCLGFFPSQ